MLRLICSYTNNGCSPVGLDGQTDQRRVVLLAMRIKGMSVLDGNDLELKALSYCFCRAAYPSTDRLVRSSIHSSRNITVWYSGEFGQNRCASIPSDLGRILDERHDPGSCMVPRPVLLVHCGPLHYCTVLCRRPHKVSLQDLPHWVPCSIVVLGLGLAQKQALTRRLSQVVPVPCPRLIQRAGRDRVSHNLCRVIISILLFLLLFLSSQ